MLKENKMEIRYHNYLIKIGNNILANKLKYYSCIYKRRVSEFDLYAIHKRIKRDDRA